MENSCFIAYHGSKEKTGTYVMGLDLLEYINKLTTVNGKCYCGPDTDEHNFEEHAAKVIPFSKTFLLVVNDTCSVLDPEGPNKYLAGEVQAFLDLVNAHKRNRKDFAVYYCGNICTSVNDRINYVQYLLSKIDEEHILTSGNHNIVVNLNELRDFVLHRIENKEIYFSGEYVQFDPLVNRAREFFSSGRERALFLKTDAGMGKTRFISWLAEKETQKNEMQGCYGEFLHLTFPIGGFSSYGKFLETFNLALTKGQPTRNTLYDSTNSDDAQTFSAYVNEVVRELYPKKHVVIALDAVDESNTVAKKNPLSLFEDLSLYDGNIQFFFTARRETGNYSLAYKRFLEAHEKEEYVLRIDDDEYDEFWEDYYREFVLGQFPKEAVKQYFTHNVERKDMVTLNLLYRIATIYLATLGVKNMDKADIKIVLSLENALNEYILYLSGLSENKSFSHFSPIELPVLLSLAEDMTADEIRSASVDLFRRADLSKLLTENPEAMKILIQSENSHNEERFSIRYNTIKSRLIEMNEATVNEYFRIIYQKFTSKDRKSLTTLLHRYPSLHHFLKFFFSNSHITKVIEENIIPLVKNIISCFVPSFFSEADMQSTQNQVDVLKRLFYNRDIMSGLTATEKARLATKLAVYEQVLVHNQDAAFYYEKSFAYWKETETMTPDDKALYYELYSTYGNICIRIKRQESPVDCFRTAYELAQELYPIGKVPLYEYSNTMLAYGNVSSMSVWEYPGSKNSQFRLETDREMLEKAYTLLQTGSESETCGQWGWYYQRLSSYESRCGNYEKAAEYMDVAMEKYEYAYAKYPGSFHLSNLVATIGSKFYSLAENGKGMSDEELIDYVDEKVDELNDFAASTNFYNYDTEVYMLKGALTLLKKAGDRRVYISLFERLKYLKDVVKEESIFKKITAVLEMQNDFNN